MLISEKTDFGVLLVSITLESPLGDSPGPMIKAKV